MFRFLFRIFIFIFIIFIIPALLHLALWSFKTRPQSWRQANWSSAQILPKTPPIDQAEIYLMSARTGGLKGAFSTHSWLVLKPLGAKHYDRYDVVGWGKPVRKNAYDADGHWYSNVPTINHKLKGDKAARLIPKLEAAIAAYPWRKRGDYKLWPGPNSNTFIETIVQTVPELQFHTPATGVGRDFPADGNWFSYPSEGGLKASLGGYMGITLGKTQGLKLDFLGLVVGVNPVKKEIAIPAFGSYRW